MDINTVVVRKPTEEETAAGSKWPIWSKEVSEFDYSYSQHEHCLIIEGEVDVVVGSKTFSFTGGDYVIFPKGMKCRWIVKKDVKKHYDFRD